MEKILPSKAIFCGIFLRSPYMGLIYGRCLEKNWFLKHGHWSSTSSTPAVAAGIVLSSSFSFAKSSSMGAAVLLVSFWVYRAYLNDLMYKTFIEFLYLNFNVLSLNHGRSLYLSLCCLFCSMRLTRLFISSSVEIFPMLLLDKEIPFFGWMIFEKPKTQNNGQ